MTFRQLREFYSARPFQRFVMHLADGQEIPVPHPEWMMLVPDGRTVYVSQRDGTVNAVDLRLVTNLEIRPEGRAKGRKQRAAGGR
jgi:hypothetical protein